MTKFLSKFGEQQLVMVNYACGFNQSETGKYFEWIIKCIIAGYAWAEDKEHCEEYGRMLQADPAKVSPRAKKRGLPQVLYV